LTSTLKGRSKLRFGNCGKQGSAGYLASITFSIFPKLGFELACNHQYKTHMDNFIWHILTSILEAFRYCDKSEGQRGCFWRLILLLALCVLVGWFFWSVIRSES